MAFVKMFSVILMLLMASCGVCFGVIYRVGDSKGWTYKANFDYERWAASKNFHAGDIIQFNYDPREDNVLRVKHKNFQTCNVTNPIRVIASGQDSITIRKSHTHLFFISGVPGHCEAGQKVDVRVVPCNSKSDIRKPSTTNSLAPAPSPISAAPSLMSNIRLFMATAFVALFAF